MLEVEIDDDDDVGDGNVGFDVFPSFGDDILSSSLLYLLLLLNLFLFCLFDEKLVGGFVVGDVDDNDGLSGDIEDDDDDDNDDGNVGDCCGCIQPPPYI